jgi:hypothetical protein
LSSLTPFDLFRTLLSDSRAETLLKAGQTSLLEFFAGNGFNRIDNYWASIRICIRNAYIVEDVSLWRDYIDLLRFFGKDLHNAQYVCPAGYFFHELASGRKSNKKPFLRFPST